jgi:hypothetical protein
MRFLRSYRECSELDSISNHDIRSELEIYKSTEKNAYKYNELVTACGKNGKIAEIHLGHQTSRDKGHGKT